jgi:integrase/recombinase XerD
LKSNYLHPSVFAYLSNIHFEKNLAPSTIDAYRRDLSSFCVWLHRRKLTLINATRQNMQDYIEDVLSGLRTTSANRHIASIAAYFRWAVREQLVETNPTFNISLARLPPRNIYVLSRAQIEGLLRTPNINTIRGVRNRAILELLYGAGLRVGELLNIRAHQIDLSQRIIIITGKGAKERVIIFGEECATWLKLWMNMRSYVLFGIRPSEYLFFGIANMNDVHYNPKPLAHSTLYAWLQRTARKSSVLIPTPLALHTLRHSYATHMYQQGADLRAIQMLLGHSSIQTTAIYTHALTPHLRSVANHHPRNFCLMPRLDNGQRT